jgi:protein SCO1/2
MTSRLLAAPLALVFWAMAALPAGAQISGRPSPGYRQEPAMPASAMPKALREIGFDQKLDAQLPLDATLRDEDGRTVRLGEYFGDRPVVLAFVYYECPMLCTQILSSITNTLGILSPTPARTSTW